MSTTVRVNRGKLVPMTGDYMGRMNKIYTPKLGWCMATISGRRRGFATAMVLAGIHLVPITVAMQHSQGVTMEYVA